MLADISTSHPKKKLDLSVLDFSKFFENGAELGPYVEALGYKRYWFAEHPPQPSIEIFVALLAAMTSSMRVGTGGVVLPVRDIEQSARNLRFLNSAFEGRIDMGFCLGIPSTYIDSTSTAFSASAIASEGVDRMADDWIAELIGGLSVHREEIPQPEIWYLGTSSHSAARAAALGTCYAFSVFHRRSVDDPNVFAVYRRQFRRTGMLSAARTMLAFSGVCAATDAKAEQCIDRRVSHELRPVAVGSPKTCAEQLRELVVRYQPDELMLHDMSASIEDKRESYRLWAGIIDSMSL
jgi:alkanesulfonate monooxygenase SsuD/methylene tetrahydromethanopterin reductase-like flavin-dependent oxidoreductase (luciferase family)